MMITKLHTADYKMVKPLLPGLESHPVINGVIDGNNPGEIYADDKNNPTTTFIWAKNEMFYLCGNVENGLFNTALEGFIATTIRPDAQQNGEVNLNLEIYPNHDWNGSIHDIFQRVKLLKGERVPFIFHKEWYTYTEPISVPEGYELKKITPELVDQDISHTIKNEIQTFWGDPIDSFYQKGFGFAVVQDTSVIGTCISVFVSGNDFEIGINTYDTQHRGKGLATAMARAFVEEALKRGVTPHWTTESFRVDSVAIAKKVGFEQLENYPAYFLPFTDFIIK
ncbi:GNAT family N-acetyltransferase [Fredinandcohnia humi]